MPGIEPVNVCSGPEVILSAISFSSCPGQTGIVSSSYAPLLFAIFALPRNTSVFVCAIAHFVMVAWLANSCGIFF